MRTLRGVIPVAPEARAHLIWAADVLNLRDREGFIDTIAVFIAHARNNSELSTEIACGDAQLFAAAKAVRSAHAAVAKLTPGQKVWLGSNITEAFAVPRQEAQYAQKEKGGPLILEYHAIREAWGGPAWLDPTMDPDTEDNLATILLEAVDAAFNPIIGRSPHVAEGRKGKPKGAKTQWPMHEFVLSLWGLGHHCGGRVTLSNTGGKAGGSIVALLIALKPMLPKHYFPAILNYSFLRNVQKSLPPAPRNNVSIYSD